MASETKPPKKLLALESLPPGQWWQVIEEECECSEGEEEGEVMEAVVDDYDVVAAIADYAASNPHPSGDEIEMQRDVIRECIRLKERQAACLLFASERKDRMECCSEACIHYAQVRLELIAEIKQLHTQLASL